MANDYKSVNVLFESDSERERMHARAIEHGFESTSAFLKFCGFNARIDISIGKYPTVENLKTLRDMYKEEFITFEELQQIKKAVLSGDSKPLICALKERGKK